MLDNFTPTGEERKVLRKDQLTATAKDYHDKRGWVPLKLYAKTKKPVGDAWQKRTLATPLPQFEDDSNIGILLGKNSSGLVRFDFDFKAVPDVHELLFPTGAVFGRKGSPSSSKLLICHGLKSTDFKLPKAMLGDERLPQHDDNERSLVVLQILATGKQTMAPPSIHPETGELLQWTHLPEQLPEMEASKLLRLAGVEATLMVARHFWPARGTRNEAAMALARTLLEALAPIVADENQLIDLVDDLVLCVAMAGGDGEDSRQGKQRAASTLEKMKAGEETTGLPRLVELLELPPAVTKTIKKWLRMIIGGTITATSIKGKPVIRYVQSEPAAAVDATERALTQSKQPVLKRAGFLVQPLWSRYKNSNGDEIQTTTLKRLTAPNLEYMINKHVAVYIRYDERKEQDVFIPPPQRVLESLLELGHWGFPPVAGVISTPTLGPQGELVTAPGYDPATQLWHWPDKNLVLPLIPDKPTEDEAKAALKLLNGLLEEVEFISNLDRSVALAAILTACCVARLCWHRCSCSWRLIQALAKATWSI